MVGWLDDGSITLKKTWISLELWQIQGAKYQHLSQIPGAMQDPAPNTFDHSEVLSNNLPKWVCLLSNNWITSWWSSNNLPKLNHYSHYSDHHPTIAGHLGSTMISHYHSSAMFGRSHREVPQVTCFNSTQLCWKSARGPTGDQSVTPTGEVPTVPSICGAWYRKFRFFAVGFWTLIYFNTTFGSILHHFCRL